MSQETTNQGLPNRWLLAGGGVLMQLALGAVYARPLLVANIRQSTGKYDLALIVIALIMLVSSVLPLIVRAHRVEGQAEGAGAGARG
jgi:hypothetical protein